MNKHSAYLTLYTSVFLLGLNGLFSNGLNIDATSLSHMRSVIAGITLVAFIYCSKNLYCLGNKRDYYIVYSLGGLLGLHWVTYFYAMQTASVAIGMLALYTYPIITILIEPFFARKKIQHLDILLAILVLIGLLIIVSDHISNSTNGVVIGVISGIVSAIFFALRNVSQKYYCSGIGSDTLMLHQLLTVVLMLTPFINTKALLALPNIEWGYIILLGVFTTALAHTLLVKSYKIFPAKTVAMVCCLQPVLGGIFAWIILGEEMTISTIIGGSIILGVATYESAKASL